MRCTMSRTASVGWILVAMSIVAVLPLAAAAQGTSAASISGVVTDSSGGVMSGVAVEVSSPVLIERVRTTMTDDRGEYRIVELRPGTYAVTFARQGFASLRREGPAAVTPTNAQDGHFGLPGVRERAEQIAGRVEVWSEAGKGTEVALTIPGATVYAAPRPRRHVWSLAGRRQANS